MGLKKRTKQAQITYTIQFWSIFIYFLIKTMMKRDHLAQMQHKAHFRMKMSYVWSIYS